MAQPLAQRTIDCALSVLDQTPPDTAGPLGRLKSLVNCLVTKYLAATATPGVATGARVKLEQRSGFRALTSTVRSNADGTVITPPWSPAELLESLDDQLVSINRSIPRVENNASWTGYPGSRVLTNKLKQSIVHTTNSVMQDPDDSWLAGVTCSTWVQKDTNGKPSVYFGFKSDNGAWATVPQAITTSLGTTMPKTRSDGTRFWVTYIDKTTSKVLIAAFDTNGAQLGTTTDTNLQVTDTATNYDVTPIPSGGVLLVAPAASNHLAFATATWSGSAIVVTNNTDTSTSSGGNVGFVENPVNSLVYVATNFGTALNGYEITAMAATHSYSFPALPNFPPDSLIGWVDSSLNMFVTVGILSQVQTQGPLFDPRARQTITYECTRGGSASTVKTDHSVIPVSRAFELDNEWYAFVYYQGGSGFNVAPGNTPVTWTSGDQMKGAAVQPLFFSPGDYQFGQNVTPIHNALDGVSTPIGPTTGYSFNNVPVCLSGLSNSLLGTIYQAAATLTISGASHSGNNGTFQVNAGAVSIVGDVLTIQCVTSTQVAETFGTGVTATLRVTDSSISPFPNWVNTWVFNGAFFPDASWLNENLFVTGTSQSANWGAYQINGSGTYTVPGQHYVGLTGSAVNAQPEVIPNPVQPTAVVQLQLADPTTAYQFKLQSVTFTSDMVGWTIAVNNSGVLANNTVYQIVQITGTHTCIAVPLNGSSNQVNRAFQNTVKITLGQPSANAPSLQPTWFISPLAVTTQKTVGRFEYGLAYSDWRQDGATDSPTNDYPCAVSSVVQTTAGLQVLLPYRAESFSAGVTSPTGNPVNAFFSTVGLKSFTLSTQAGQALTVGGELIIPGPQASEFTSSSFAEQGINLGPELPFIISQSNDGTIPFGLTPGTAYQYVVVFEYTDEDGDRIFSVPSPALNVNLTTANNTITIGGNILQQTQRLVTISIYRTSIAGGSTTVQHYKITNDTDPNGAGFTFPDAVTWNFKDQRPDSEILVSEVLYTDKGFLPRYPCPAFSQGVGTWRNRTWVIGYDNAVWMSGEKTEGDAVWFHPAFRYILPTDDEPAALAAMDDYMLVLGAETNWYIPSVQFPDATGNNGQLPAPVQLPFANGCTGFAVTTRDGVLYSSTAGGVWLIQRNLTNGWISQAIQSSLGLTAITGMAVDKNQRVAVAAGGSDVVYVWDTVPGAWYQWVTVSAVLTLATWKGDFVYGDDSRVYQYTPGNYADNDGNEDVAIPPSWALAPVHLMNSVRGYGRCWAFQVQGEYKGAHLMGLTLGYGDEVDYQPPTVYPPKLASSTLSYLYEWNPQEEEASQFELSFAVTFPNGVTGNSATWELIAFDVGVDQGLARVASQKRVSSV